MHTPEEMAAAMADKSNEELSAMFGRPDDWQPEALEAARAELQRRGIDPAAVVGGPPPLAGGEAMFFAVSPLKLVLMSTVTMGLYEVFWLPEFLAPLPLIPVQVGVNRLNAVVARDHVRNTRFSAWNIARLVVGGIFFVLAVVGTFLPEK
jgi:hypothetical protein